MILQLVCIHADCPSLTDGRTQVVPKFGIVGHSEDGSQLRLECPFCRGLLTLTLHSPDNPPEAFPCATETEEIPDAPKRAAVDVGADT